MRAQSANPAQAAWIGTYTSRMAYAALATLLLMISMSVLATDVKVNLLGDQEVPPVSTTAKGSGTISIHPDMTVTGGIKTTGIEATMAHIHVGAAGANGPIAIGLMRGGEGAWQVPMGSKLTEEQYRAYKAGELYVNVHSVEHKGGEIRGQLAAPPAPATPSATHAY
jgi:hypothetical protein